MSIPSKKRRLLWSKEAEKALLPLWAQRIDDLQKTRKTLDIYDEIAKELAKMGFYATASSVKDKIHNFKKKFSEEQLLSAAGGYYTLDWDDAPNEKPLFGYIDMRNVRSQVDESINLDESDDSIEMNNVPETNAVSKDNSLVKSSPVVLSRRSKELIVPKLPAQPPIEPKAAKTFQEQMIEQFKKNNELMKKLLDTTNLHHEKMNEISERFMKIEQERNEILKSLCDKL